MYRLLQRQTRKNINPNRSKAVTLKRLGDFYFMKQIPLTQGQFALVDDEDFDLISKFKWHITKNKNARTMYAETNKKGVKHTKMHRLIMGCVKGDGKMIDHKDGNGLNNQRSNLRFCTHSENMRNIKSARGSSSKYLGVCFFIHSTIHNTSTGPKMYSYPRWKSRIVIDGKAVHVGTFKTENEAAIAYNKAAEKHYGEFARLNVIE